MTKYGDQNDDRRVLINTRTMHYTNNLYMTRRKHLLRRCGKHWKQNLHDVTKRHSVPRPHDVNHWRLANIALATLDCGGLPN